MNPYLGESRIGRSLDLIGVAWRLISRDRAMLMLAGLAAVANIGGGLLILELVGWGPHTEPHGQRLIVALVVVGYPLTFVSTFLNVAVAAAASESLEGRHLSVAGALRASTRRIGQIALWSALATGIGVLLQEIASRLPAGGRLASWAFGAAWSLVTLFAIPILALEGCGAVACVRRSAHIMRSRWAEGLSGTVAVSAAFTVAIFCCCAVMGTGGAVSAGSPGAGFTLVVVGMVGVMVCATAANAVRQVFAVALYRYATTGEASGGFADADLAEPTTKRA